MRIPLLHRCLGIWVLLLAWAATASADIQVTIPTPTPSMDSVGDPDNTIVTWTSTLPRFRVGDSLNFLSGQLHSLFTAGSSSAAPRHSSFRMRFSRYPGVYQDFTPHNGTGPYTYVNIPTTVYWGFSSEVEYLEVYPGDKITFEFFQNASFRDNLPEAEWLDAVINLEVYNPTVPNAEDLGLLTNGTEIQQDFVDANEVKWYKFLILTDTMTTRFLDIENSGSTDFVRQDTTMGLYDNEGFRVGYDVADGSDLAAALSFGEAMAWGGRSAVYPDGIIRNGQDGQLAPGTYYLAVAPGGANFSTVGFQVTNPTAATGNIVTTFIKGVDSAPAWPPADVMDLGTLSGPGTLTRFTPMLSGHWYKVNLPAIQTPGWLDLDTEATMDFLSVVNASIRQNFTVLALYDAAGNFLVKDDSNGMDFRALLSFGDTTNRGTGRFGQDGQLSAGTYYLYVGGYQVQTGQGNVATNSQYSGPVVLAAQYCPPNKRSLVAKTHLWDWTGTADRMMHWQLLDGPGGTVLEQGFTTADFFGRCFVLVDTMSGTGRVLTLKASHWLRSARENLNLNNSVVYFIMDLHNGDVDGDNEVGPGDFSELSAAFGSVSGDANWSVSADLDGDGEVGPNDFGILSANFGMSGY